MRNCDWSSDVGSSDLLLVRLGQHGDALGEVDPAELPALLVHMMDEVAVRPPAGGHPRLAIYGLIEARLQRADLMILGSLNEGVWPALPSPDPWLAPRIRAELGLRSEEHTSELQSLMRISYAVLCLKKKNKNTT